jgi:cell division protease FtsH
MSPALGPMVYAENEGEVFLGRSVTKTTNMSEATMQLVDTETRRIIDEQYAVARKLIEENADKMHAMAKALLEFETIDADQIGDIMAGRPARQPKESGKSGTSGGPGSDSSTPNSPNAPVSVAPAGNVTSGTPEAPGTPPAPSAPAASSIE